MERHLTIGVVLFLIAELFLIIWAAVILLVLRDKVLGNRFPKPVWDEEEVVAKQAPLPRWKLWLRLAPLGVILLPGVLVIVFVIAAPLVACASRAALLLLVAVSSNRQADTPVALRSRGFRRSASGCPRPVLSRPGLQRLGTCAPHSRQTIELRWTGLPQRGQTRRPASTLTRSEGGFVGTGIVAVVSWPSSPAGCGAWAWRRFFHWSRAARSVVLSSSVIVSGWPVERFSLDDDGFAPMAAGTGTTRPQSGHLPDSGIGLSGSTRSFSRRPQGQPNRMKPSLSPGPGGPIPLGGPGSARAFGTDDPLGSVGGNASGLRRNDRLPGAWRHPVWSRFTQETCTQGPTTEARRRSDEPSPPA